MTMMYQDNQWRGVDGPKARVGVIPIPLASLRLVTANDILATASDAGVLSKNTAPILEYKATSTDGVIRVNWAATVVAHLAFQTPVPVDVDPSQVMLIRFLAAMGGATDVPTLSTDVYFNVGGTKRTNATAAVTGVAVLPYTATIAAAQIPTLPWTLSCEVTPSAHGTDALFLYAVWIEYQKI